MKRINLLFALVISCCLISSCDFVRSVFGMPTSEDLDKLRVEKALQAEQALRDSLAQVAIQDSLAVLALENSKPTSINGHYVDSLDRSYYVALGLFENASNADKLAQKFVEQGHEVWKVTRRSGKVMVVTCPADDYNEVILKRSDLLLLPFCPVDASIYDNTKNIHK